MIRRTDLPTMKTASYDIVMGTIKMGIKERKLTAVFGTPGSGKTTLLNDIEMEYPNAHRILCSPTMTMKNLMVQIANCINVPVKGDTYTVQHMLTEALQENPNHILLFDESEYLHHGNVTKIDVLRQIYDESNTHMVLCGTYKLKSLLSGNNRDHNQPQIFRRLLKAEFKPVTKDEFIKYLDDLEKLLLIRFKSEARNELFSLCTDMENGGLGIFIYLLENTLMFIRPEWKEICASSKQNAPYDTSQLSEVVIDKDILKQSARFQMKK